ncbi:helix-turn-helix domain-containing protein [Amycolatopsis sp. cg5]|uniref:helix-turn-helix domain-containing protein n=1 Tax=Amycolatopsis sp. cg5 TaxID=3238802 RepID=UPI003523ACFB
MMRAHTPISGPDCGQDALRWAAVSSLPMPDTRVIGGWIRWVRAVQHMTGKQLAARARCSENLLYKIERSEQPLMSVELAVRLADVLCVPRELLVVRAVMDFRYEQPRYENGGPFTAF